LAPQDGKQERRGRFVTPQCAVRHKPHHRTMESIPH
jgi:hypothetical protein